MHACAHTHTLSLSPFPPLCCHALHPEDPSLNLNWGASPGCVPMAERGRAASRLPTFLIPFSQTQSFAATSPTKRGCSLDSPCLDDSDLATSSQPLASAGWKPRQQPPLPCQSAQRTLLSAGSRGRDGTCFFSPPGRLLLLPHPPQALYAPDCLERVFIAMTSLLPNARHEIGASIRGLEENPGWDHL